MTGAANGSDVGAPVWCVRIGQPALAITTRADRGVPFAHASSIRRAELVESRADTYFVWLGTDWPTITGRIGVFRSTDPLCYPVAAATRADFSGQIGNHPRTHRPLRRHQPEGAETADLGRFFRSVVYGKQQPILGVRRTLAGNKTCWS